MPDLFDKGFHPVWKKFVGKNLNHLAYPLLAFLLWPNFDRESFSGPDFIRFQLPWVIWANSLVLFLVASVGGLGQIWVAVFIAQIQRFPNEMLNRGLH
jgi:hypothetical protein